MSWLIVEELLHPCDVAWHHNVCRDGQLSLVEVNGCYINSINAPLKSECLQPIVTLTWDSWKDLDPIDYSR
jgi:hypothetical protein